MNCTVIWYEWHAIWYVVTVNNFENKMSNYQSHSQEKTGFKPCCEVINDGHPQGIKACCCEKANHDMTKVQVACTGEILDVPRFPKRFNCHTQRGVYGLETGCGLPFVGKTTQPLLQILHRFKSGRFAYHPAINEHLSHNVCGEECCTIEAVKWRLLVDGTNLDDYQLLVWELYFILKLKTLNRPENPHTKGLNERAYITPGMWAALGKMPQINREIYQMLEDTHSNIFFEDTPLANPYDAAL